VTFLKRSFKKNWDVCGVGGNLLTHAPTLDLHEIQATVLRPTPAPYFGTHVLLRVAIFRGFTAACCECNLNEEEPSREGTQRRTRYGYAASDRTGPRPFR
jgi:hypothetical protein